MLGFTVQALRCCIRIPFSITRPALRSPAQIFGALVTEKVRSLGAMLVNVDGEAFMHPLETRDVAAASIIRECTDRHKGVTTPLAPAFGSIPPMIEQKRRRGHH